MWLERDLKSVFEQNNYVTKLHPRDEITYLEITYLEISYQLSAVSPCGDSVAAAKAAKATAAEHNVESCYR